MNTRIKYGAGALLAALALGFVAPKGDTQAVVRQPGLTIVGDGTYHTPVVVGPNGMQPYYDPGADPNYNPYMTYTPNVYNVSFGPNDIPRTVDAITVRKEANNRLYMQWQGEPRAVRSITFALLDKNNRPIREQTITSPPAETRMTKTTKTTGYSVTVLYINGMTSSVVSPL